MEKIKFKSSVSHELKFYLIKNDWQKIHAVCLKSCPVRLSHCYHGKTKSLSCILMPHTYCIDAASVGSDPQAASAAFHAGDHGPLVGVWVVVFSRGRDVMAIETSTNVHLKKNWAAFTMSSITFTYNINQYFKVYL